MSCTSTERWLYKLEDGDDAWQSPFPQQKDWEFRDHAGRAWLRGVDARGDVHRLFAGAAFRFVVGGRGVGVATRSSIARAMIRSKSAPVSPPCAGGLGRLREIPFPLVVVEGHRG